MSLILPLTVLVPSTENRINFDYNIVEKLFSSKKNNINAAFCQVSRLPKLLIKPLQLRLFKTINLQRFKQLHKRIRLRKHLSPVSDRSNERL